MILRRNQQGYFQVVGEAYIHGLEDCNALLGPLPTGWAVNIEGDRAGRPLHRYLNLQNGQLGAEDPRLAPLPSEWERVAYERTSDHPAYFEMFRNSTTGETMNSDPRLLPNALEALGIKLKTFGLV